MKLLKLQLSTFHWFKERSDLVRRWRGSPLWTPIFTASTQHSTDACNKVGMLEKALRDSVLHGQALA
jgi:hypothetical protein